MSLLKRIEQGQGTAPEQSASTPSSTGGDASRLSSLQARRVSAPSAAPKREHISDLKTRVQNSASGRT